MIMVTPIGNFHIRHNRGVLFACKMVYMISFNKISLLVVTSFNGYDNIHNVIMIMVTPIGNSHIRYNRGVIFAWDGRMYNKFQSCVSTCIPNIISYCPACRTTLIATRFRVAVICPIIQVPHCIRVFFYFVWFVFINHIFQFYYELCTYCNILDIYLS